MSDKKIIDTEPTKQTGRNIKRKIITYMAAEIASGTTSMALWSGVVKGAEEHDLNLIAIVGGNITEAKNNIVYDLVTPEIFTGIINWTIRMNFTNEELVAIHTRYQPLPMVTILRKVPGHPIVNSNDYQGMKEAVAHLIEIHGCRRLAFIRAREDHNPLAEQRYRAYRETLEHYSIPFDPKLVTPAWDWAQENGERAVTLFLDERGLRPGQDIDAIVSISDLMVISALKALQNRNIRIPEDMALIGFNDSVEAQVAIPSVTSVATHLPRQGHQAVCILKDLIEQSPVPEQVLIPARLIVHQSCGCLDDTVVQAAAFSPPDVKKNSQSATFNVRSKNVLQDILQTMSITDESEEAAWAEKLVHAFSINCDTPDSGEFLTVLRQTLQHAALTGKEVLPWQNALSAIQRNLNLCRNQHQALLLLGQARTMVGNTASQYLAQQQLQAEHDAMQLRLLNQKLLTTFDKTQLTTVLLNGMRSLRIPGCYLALYENPQPYNYPQPAPEWSRLILAYDKDRHITLEPGGTRFPTHQILPEGIWPEDRRYTIILQALYFQDSQIGFVLFEIGPKNWTMYDILRAQISSSLQGALLFEEAKKNAGHLDTIVNETMTITEEMQATISETSQQAKAVSDAAQASMNVSMTGQDVVIKTVAGMETIQHHVEDISRSIIMLSEHTQNIEEIISTLENIVEQSKIMALNASIQAARAGDKGNAFAVVAREMRTLAEKSREAISRISKILNEIRHSANTAVMVTKEGSSGAKHSMELAKHAGETIHELTMTINQAAQMAVQIATSTKQQTNAMSQLITAMISVKEASSQTSTSFKEVGS